MVNDIKNAFKKLENDCNYLVLRNFEGYYEDLFLGGEHADIDLLCGSLKDRDLIVNAFNVRNKSCSDGFHYFFLMDGGAKVTIDIRIVGDGYYDKKWQIKMLKNRVFDNRGFYKMDKENYFYSLVYHAIYQKHLLSREYLDRLNFLNNSNEFLEQENFELMLYNYMKLKKYYYTITLDRSVIKNFSNPLIKDRIKYPKKIKKEHLNNKRKIIKSEFKSDYKSVKQKNGAIYAFLWGMKNFWKIYFGE